MLTSNAQHPFCRIKNDSQHYSTRCDCMPQVINHSRFCVFVVLDHEAPNIDVDGDVIKTMCDKLFGIYCNRIHFEQMRKYVYKYIYIIYIWSTLPQVMAYWLIAPNPYPNQHGIISNGILWHSPKTISQEVINIKISSRTLCLKDTYVTFSTFLWGLRGEFIHWGIGVKT